jgi:chromosomal replication initiation ATPase DnaA
MVDKHGLMMHECLTDAEIYEAVCNLTDAVKQLSHSLMYVKDRLNGKINHSLDQVINLAAEMFNVPPGEVISKERGYAALADARALAMWALMRECMYTQPQIVKIFSRHHSTVLHNIHKVDAWIGDQAIIRTAMRSTLEEARRAKTNEISPEAAEHTPTES